jgi:glycosyltransferase involved in cell wall biosynthesis
MRFQILIPTYNREDYLRRNLIYLKDQLIKYSLANDFGVIVSDNASSDGTWAMLRELKESWNGEVQLEILRNETNEGLEQNSINLLKAATSEFIIWLGDDDFLADGYLKFMQERLINNLGWIVPGMLGVDKNGNKLDPRPAPFYEKEFQPGFATMWEVSHLGHQLSGLVLKRKNLLESYLAHPEWRNPYLFLYFLADCQLRYPGIYAPGIKNLVNIHNSKYWSYNEVWLIDEVFKCYYYFIEKLGQKKVNSLLLRFIVMHSYRIDFTKGLPVVLKQWRIIVNKAPEAKEIRFPLLFLLIKEYTSRKLNWSGNTISTSATA